MTLEDLLVSGDDLDKEVLRTALIDYVRIEKETLKIRPQAGFRHLTGKGKVIAFLLARKGMRAMGLIDSDKASPADVIGETGLPSGSAYPTLKALYEQRPQIVERDKESNYWIPNWAIDDAVSVLEGGKDRDE